MLLGDGSGFCRTRRGAGVRCRRDGGFSLLETIIAMFILSLLVTSSVPFFVGVLQASNGLATKQTAVTVASRQLEYIRSIQPTSLVSGRNSADVAALILDRGPVNLTGDVTSTGNSDSYATSGSASATVPLISTQVLNGTTYTTRSYVDVCYLSSLTGLCTPSILNGPAAWRVSVDVSWPRPANVECVAARAGQCDYVATTLIDPSADPVFSTGSAPQIVTVLDATGTPTVALSPIHPGQRVTLQILGNNFMSGAYVYSSSADLVGAVSNNTGTSLTVPVTASPILGNRTLVLVNPNGSSDVASLTVALSSPTITGLSPSTAPRLTSRTFTLTGTDFFATPTTAAPVVQPSITMVGSGVYLGVTYPVIPVISGVSVTSSGMLTFQAIFPYAPFTYSTSGTLTLTNPDTGNKSFAYTVAVT